ncbi:MAG: hypothetical protein CMK59_07990 [Proteobacteria bacterium]|nr:hypothetical protein [Pseudomonadota bacterium]
MSTIPSELLKAYTDTDYVVHASPDFILNISKHSNAFAQLTKTLRCWEAVFITAHNPYSKPQSPLKNKESNDLLEDEIIQNGWTYFKGVGQSKDCTWKEDSFLIFNIDQQSAYNLGKRHRQNAVVWIGSNCTPILLICK